MRPGELTERSQGAPARVTCLAREWPTPPEKIVKKLTGRLKKKGR
jgi:hypothetical protein